MPHHPPCYCLSVGWSCSDGYGVLLTVVLSQYLFRSFTDWNLGMFSLNLQKRIVNRIFHVSSTYLLLELSLFPLRLPKWAYEGPNVLEHPFREALHHSILIWFLTLFSVIFNYTQGCTTQGCWVEQHRLRGSENVRGERRGWGRSGWHASEREVFMRNEMPVRFSLYLVPRRGPDGPLHLKLSWAHVEMLATL